MFLFLGITTLILAVILLILAVIVVSIIVSEECSLGPGFLFGIPFLLIDGWMFFLAVYFFIKF